MLLAWASQQILLTPVNFDFTDGVLDPRITFTRSTTGTRVNASGLIESVAIDGPRFDYDPATLEPGGLLIERQSTNLFLWSEKLDSWGTATTNNTVALDAATGPDGATTADKWTRNSTAAAYLGRSVTKAASALTYAYSVWVKKDVGDYVALRMQTISPNTADVVFNLAAGTISTAPTVNGTVTVATATITEYLDGWYRVTLTATTDTNTTVVGFLSFNSGGGVLDAVDTAPDSSGYAWGNQLEQAPFVTSYIPTTSAQVTRAGDIATMTGMDFSSWWNPIEGTVIIGADNPASGTRIVWQADDGTADNRITIWTDGTIAKADIVTGGVSQTALTLGTITANVPFKIALAFAANDVAASLDGATEVTDTSVTLPTVDRCRFGLGTLGNFLCGHVRSFKAYRIRQSDVEVLAT